MNSLYYYLNEQKEVLGPLSLEELLSQLQKGDLTPQTLIAQKGEKSWRPLSSFAPQATPVAIPARTPSPEAPPREPSPAPLATHSPHTTTAQKLPNDFEEELAESEESSGIWKSLSFSTKINEVIYSKTLSLSDLLLKNVPDRASLKKLLIHCNTSSCSLTIIAMVISSYAMTKEPLVALGAAVIGLILQYVLFFFCKSNAQLTLSRGTSLSSELWPQVFGIFSLFLGVVLILGGLGAAFANFSLFVLLAGMGVAFLFTSAISFHSSRYIMEEPEAATSSDNRGEFVSFLKYYLKLNLLLSQIITPCLLLGSIIFFLQQAFKSTAPAAKGPMNPTDAMSGFVTDFIGHNSSTFLIVGNLFWTIPILAYFTYIILGLSLDFIEAVIKNKR